MNLTATTTATFVRADSVNLPQVDMAMLMEFMKTSDKHNVAEIRGAKALMSSRESYVDSAVGYVEVSRANGICLVRAKVVPEHKIASKYYIVGAEIDEQNQVIKDTECIGCAAAAGGCKHTLVLLYWLEKRSSEPSTTSTRCYWLKPTLSSARQEVKEITKIFDVRPNPIGNRDATVLQKFLAEAGNQPGSCSRSLIVTYGTKNEKISHFCLFDLMVDFVSQKSDHSFENFKSYSLAKVIDKIKSIATVTASQANCKLWHCMRQGRITGSKLYDIAHCKTANGSLVQEMLGGYKVPETLAIKRGKLLEKKVVNKLEINLKVKVTDAGFYLVNGFIGASPDGIGSDFVVEIKCPTSEKTKMNYFKNDALTEKCKAQVQLQMLATGKKKCWFCLADPNFEENGMIEMHLVKFDATYIENIISLAEEFWKFNVYPKILDSASIG